MSCGGQISREQADLGPQIEPDERLRPKLAALLLPLLVWIVFVASDTRQGNRITPDSAHYIDCARSICESRGFQTRVEEGLGSQTWEPMRLWPPGYPLLIAGLMHLGFAPYYAALAVAIACSGLFVILVLHFYATRLPPLVAALLGLAFVSMPPLVRTSSMCWSEGPYILLTVASLLCLIQNSKEGTLRVRWLMAAGVAGGLSWCVRNAAVALFVSSVCYLLLQTLRFRLKEVAMGTAGWLTGWILASGWLLAWNMLTFGTPHPYSMPPSDLSFFWNCRVAYEVIAWDLLPSERVLSVVGNQYTLIILLVAVVVMAARRGSWRALPSFVKSQQEWLILSLFACLYVLTVIVARSTYRWGEAINFRHFVPVYWILLVLFAVGAEWAFTRLGWSRLRAQKAVLVAVGLLAAMQLGLGGLRVPRPVSAEDLQSRRAAVSLGRLVSEDQLVLTDEAPLLRVFGNVNARCPPKAGRGLPSMSWPEIQQAGDAGRLWGVVIANKKAYERGKYGDALKDVALHPETFRQLRRRDLGSGAMTVLEYVPEERMARGRASRPF